MSGASPSPEFSLALVGLLPRLRRYARVLARESGTADDLVQDTLERAWSRHAQWRPGSDLRAWMFSIMHNRWVDLTRADRLAPLDVLDDATPEPVSENPPAFDGIDLQRGFERLSPEHREVLMLVAVEEMSYEEAAYALGVPIGTVMSRLSRARRRLRSELEDTGHRDQGPGATRLTRIK